MSPSEHDGVMAIRAHRSVVRMLVIEGDSALRMELASVLTAEGHEVETAFGGQSGLAVARTSHPDIILLELSLPDMDGIELIRAIRSEPWRRPAIFVLSGRVEESDRVMAFEAGVDDYMSKPHSMRELLLRVRSLSRRRRKPRAIDDAIVVGALKIDRAARRAAVSNQTIELTRREFDLLLHLAERVGRVQTRDVLVAEVWGDGADSGRVVDTTVKRLRKKLGPESPPIRTVRGVGYKLGAD